MKPFTELLEVRKMLYSVNADNGVLDITSDQGEAIQILIDYNLGQARTEVTVSNVASWPYTNVTYNDIEQVNVVLDNSIGDEVYVLATSDGMDAWADGLILGVTVNTGGGADFLYTELTGYQSVLSGQAPIELLGGAGNDSYVTDGFASITDQSGDNSIEYGWLSGSQDVPIDIGGGENTITSATLDTEGSTSAGLHGRLTHEEDRSGSAGLDYIGDGDTESIPIDVTGDFATQTTQSGSWYTIKLVGDQSLDLTYDYNAGTNLWNLNVGATSFSTSGVPTVNALGLSGNQDVIVTAGPGLVNANIEWEPKAIITLGKGNDALRVVAENDQAGLRVSLNGGAGSDTYYMSGKAYVTDSGPANSDPFDRYDFVSDDAYLSFNGSATPMKFLWQGGTVYTHPEFLEAPLYNPNTLTGEFTVEDDAQGGQLIRYNGDPFAHTRPQPPRYAAPTRSLFNSLILVDDDGESLRASVLAGGQERDLFDPERDVQQQLV